MIRKYVPVSGITNYELHKLVETFESQSILGSFKCGYGVKILNDSR